MITIDNYSHLTKEMDFSALPELLQRKHRMMQEISANNWVIYRNNNHIREATNRYFKELQQYIDTGGLGKTPVNSLNVQMADATEKLRELSC